MDDTPNVRHFDYRSPRYPFPKMVTVEIAQGTSYRLIGTHGIDVGVYGIAVAVDVRFEPDEPVTLVIPLVDGSTVRLPGSVLCQSQHHCRFRFDYATAEQRVQIREMIWRIANGH